MTIPGGREAINLAASCAEPTRQVIATGEPEVVAMILFPPGTETNPPGREFSVPIPCVRDGTLAGSL